MSYEFDMGGVLNICAVLSLMLPLFILSVVYARKGKHLIGGALAFSKLLLLIRFSSIWEEMLRTSGKAGWRTLGFGYSPVFSIMLMSMIAAGIICTAVNVYAFCRQKTERLE